MPSKIFFVFYCSSQEISWLEKNQEKAPFVEKAEKRKEEYEHKMADYNKKLVIHLWEAYCYALFELIAIWKWLVPNYFYRLEVLMMSPTSQSLKLMMRMTMRELERSVGIFKFIVVVLKNFLKTSNLNHKLNLVTICW